MRKLSSPRLDLTDRVLALSLGLILLVAITAPLLPLPDPNLQQMGMRLTPPWPLAESSPEHLLGTDHLGRDMLARILAGARLTLLIAFAGVALGGLFGVTMGFVAGYFGGWVDVAITRVIDAQLALPFILLAMGIVAARGRSITVLIFTLAVVSWAHYARLVRSDTQVVSTHVYIRALKAAGLPTRQIILRHIVPNVGGTILVVATLEIGTLVLGESALSFLGLGVVSPDISWGAMLAEGRAHIRESWWVVAFPGMAISALVLLVNLLGDGLHRAYDPRKVEYR